MRSGRCPSRGTPSGVNRPLRGAALAFAALAMVAGGLQIAAFASSGSIRHLVLGGFACAVGCSVVTAVIGSAIRSRRQ